MECATNLDCHSPAQWQAVKPAGRSGLGLVSAILYVHICITGMAWRIRNLCDRIFPIEIR